MPIIFITFIILSILLMFSIKRNSHRSEQDTQDFWTRESQANTTRKADISSLDYITVPEECLPFGVLSTPEVRSLEETLHAISEKPILNLSSYSNTDLKLEYGVANLSFLSECDERYLILIRSLATWGTHLYEAGLFDDAQTVLEYGVAIGTDISSHFQLLGSIYVSKKDVEKLNSLIETASKLSTPLQSSIVTNLHNIKSYM